MMLLMCHVADLRFALPVPNVVEVVGRPTLESIPTAPYWMAGAFIHRGVITPVIDFAALAGIGTAQSLWSSRVIVLQCEYAGRQRRLGLLFDRAHAEQVNDQQMAHASQAAVQILPWGKTLIDAHGTYCLLDLDIVFSPQRQATLFPTSD